MRTRTRSPFVRVLMLLRSADAFSAIRRQLDLGKDRKLREKPPKPGPVSRAPAAARRHAPAQPPPRPPPSHRQQPRAAPQLQPKDATATPHVKRSAPDDTTVVSLAANSSSRKRRTTGMGFKPPCQASVRKDSSLVQVSRNPSFTPENVVEPSVPPPTAPPWAVAAAASAAKAVRTIDQQELERHIPATDAEVMEKLGKRFRWITTKADIQPSPRIASMKDYAHIQDAW